jgi:cell division protein FtsB
MLEVFKSTSSKLILLLAIVLVASFQYSFWFGEVVISSPNFTQQITQQAEINEELKSVIVF